LGEGQLDFKDACRRDWELVINTYLKGFWLCCKAVPGRMRAQEFGRVVNKSH